MVEFLVLVATILLAAWLLRPVLRRLPVPGWLVRAHARGRPGVPVTAWLGALLLMWVAWLLGERRGLVGALLYIIWILAPLAALRVTVWWTRRPDPPAPFGTARRHFG